jgi:hypothetical protein
LTYPIVELLAPLLVKALTYSNIASWWCLFHSSCLSRARRLPVSAAWRAPHSVAGCLSRLLDACQFVFGCLVED